jgi:hypothetical protein
MSSTIKEVRPTGHSHNSQNLNSFGSREECFKTRAQIMNETTLQNPSSETTKNPPESDPRAPLPNAAEIPIIPPTASPPPEAAIAIPSVLGRIKVLTDADRAEYLIDCPDGACEYQIAEPGGCRQGRGGASVPTEKYLARPA